MKLARLIFLLSFLQAFSVLANSAVTNVLSGGRLGDNLVSLVHILWVEYKFGIPVLYKPFPYSDQLAIHDRRARYDESLSRRFSKVVELKQNGFIEFQPNSNTLYVIPYFPESMEEHRKAGYSPEIYDNLSKGMTRSWPYIHIDWNDQAFIKELKSLISPRFPTKKMQVPTDCISVAVHVRKSSGGFDLPLLSETPAEHYRSGSQYMDVNYPLKFPPDSYYVEQLKLLAELFKSRKLYVYIFTDDPNPARLAAKYAAELNNANVTFDYRREANSHTMNVLDDFFALLQFDCLIRSDSNFPLIASKIGNFKVVISPLHHTWIGRTMHVDKISVEISREA